MAGQSMRDLKRRIRGVRSTQQITRAMEMVAAAKLRRAQQQLTTGLPFTEKLETILSRVVQHRDVLQQKDAVHPLLAVREPARVLYVVVAADRGLAGGYNTNVLRLALATIQEDEREKRVVAVGRRSRDFLLRRGIELYNEGLQSNYIYVGDELSYEESRFVTRYIADMYIRGEVDEVIIIHNVFLTAASYRPTVTRLLPIEPEHFIREERDAAGDRDEDEEEPLIYVPSAEQVLSVLIPRYFDIRVYSLLLGAKAAEQGARMLAMRNATENAEEMIEQLTLSFNRARQDSITTEISEIVGGANALAGGE